MDVSKGPVEVDNNGRRIHNLETKKILESMGLSTRSQLWELDPENIKIISDAMKKKVDGLKVLTSKELETAKLVLLSRIHKCKDSIEAKNMSEAVKVIGKVEKIVEEAKSMGSGIQGPGFGRDAKEEIIKIDQGRNLAQEAQKARDDLEGKNKNRTIGREQSNNPFELEK